MQRLTRIDPANPRASNKRAHCVTGQVEGHQRVLLHIAHVDEAVSVCLKVIAHVSLPIILHRALRQQLTALTAILQALGRHTVQAPSTDETEIQILTVSRQSDAIAPKRHGRQRRIRVRGVIERPSGRLFKWRQHSPVPRSTMMITIRPSEDDSVMYAMPLPDSVSCGRRSKRMS